jgi:hypothetical protein
MSENTFASYAKVQFELNLSLVKSILRMMINDIISYCLPIYIVVDLANSKQVNKLHKLR